jgi:hypothetical protein
VREYEVILLDHGLRDSDCDEVFDEVYGLDDRPCIPGCPKQGRVNIGILVFSKINRFIDSKVISS